MVDDEFIRQQQPKSKNESSILPLRTTSYGSSHPGGIGAESSGRVSKVLPDDNKEVLRDTQKTFASLLRRPFTRVASSSKSDALDTKEKNKDKLGPRGLHPLHLAPKPLINLIFVHGLGGGSKKSWRKGDDPSMCWPQYWLPLEEGFNNASIYSFGYDSDWGSTTPSILDVHDFGRVLYEEIRTYPILKENPTSPIILVGHSMGGLVIKKAYILACQDVTAGGLAQRIRSIFFLATPHRGSDFAPILNSILEVCSITSLTSSRDYINDIKKGSLSAQHINEEFCRYAGDLHIHSFYETLPSSSLSSTLIVKRDSAVLGPGFRNERSRYMNANHRGICKFESREDPNYLSLKNSLTTAVEDILKGVYEMHEETLRIDLKVIRSFLGVTDLLDEHHEKLEGSCEWLNEREDFQEWHSDPDDVNSDTAKPIPPSPSLFWITANPGAGKTVLASHIISQLKNTRLQNAFYHFHAGKKVTESLAYCLRSMAYQMAVSNTAICEMLIKLVNEGSTFDQDDARAVWTKVFKSGILLVPMYSPYYWVIDAIDECVKFAEFFTLLKGTKPRFPLRILITSRIALDLHKYSRQLPDFVVSIVEIPPRETMKDIEMFVRSRIEDVSIDDEEQELQLIDEIVSRSNASFLWVNFVMEEIKEFYGFESIMAVIQGIPSGMLSYYKKIVTAMEENKEHHISKAILLWVIYAARPLSVSELAEAIKLDIKVNFPSPKAAIEGLCGQLVTVDKQTELVHIVHLTAREFLTTAEAGEFLIKKSIAQERIALTCLQMLMSPIMQPPRQRRLLRQKRPGLSVSCLLEYAIMQFSEHIHDASAESDKLLLALYRFLTTTVLSWIEKISERKDLHQSIRVAKNLKAYLDRRAKYPSPLNQHVNTVDRWTSDLSRLVTNFGGALVSQPQSIYFLIPPLCPTETAIYRQFSPSPDGLVVSKFENTHWDDCIATINFDAETAGAIACDNSIIAVGFRSGSIHLYDHSSFQLLQMIMHEGWVDCLLLDPLGSFVVCSSTKFLTTWDLKGKLLWRTRIRSRCMVLKLCPTSIIGFMMSGRTIAWDIKTGEEIEQQRYLYQPPDSTFDFQTGPHKAPAKAAFGPGNELLALTYRNGPTCIFELQTHCWIAWARDPNPGQIVVAVVFNPNPLVNLLLLAYDDARLALYDPWSGALILSQDSENENQPIITSLACSSDGRTFVTVDVLGNLQIWDFESLTLLYHILTPDLGRRILAFTSDDFNFVDIVEHEMKVWSPGALVRKTMEEEASTSERSAILPVTEAQLVTSQSAKIRSAVSHAVYPVVFVGNYNGDVIVYDTLSTTVTSSMTILYSHPDTVVKCVAVTELDVIASADVNACLEVWRLDVTKPSKIRPKYRIFKVELDFAIKQILFDDTGSYLLASTANADYVYDVNTGKLIGFLPFQNQDRISWKWIALSNRKYGKHFALLCNHELTIYSAISFPLLISKNSISLEYELDQGYIESGIESATIQSNTQYLILEVRQKRKFSTTSTVLVFRLAEIFTDESSTTVILRPVRTLSADFCMHFLGVTKAENRLVFLHRSLWVSSIGLSAEVEKSYTQHFFVPSEFVTNSSNILPMKAANDSFVFCLYDRLAVVRNGLNFTEIKALE